MLKLTCMHVHVKLRLYTCMLRTNCKLDQFVKRAPQLINWSCSFKLVGPLSIIQNKVVSFRNRAKCFESWPNGLEAVQACRTNGPWPKRHESWLNDLLKHTSKAVCRQRPNQRQRISDTEIDPCLHWLGLVCESNKYMYS